MVKGIVCTASNQFGWLPAEEFRREWIYESDPALQIHAANSFPRRVQDQLVLPLGLGQLGRPPLHQFL